MTTTQGPQDRVPTQGLPRGYPLPLQLRYKATSKLGPVQGFGQTTMMSSQEIIFAPGDGLKPGMAAEIAIDWPRLLDGSIRLQLVLEVTITSSRDGVTEAHIWTHDFRTRRAAGNVSKG